MSITEDPSAPDDWECVRRQHLSHEASIRAVGWLYYLGSVFWGAGVVVLAGKRETDLIPWLAYLALLAIFSGIYFVMAGWLRDLNPRVRIPCAITSVLGLLSFPVGTLINGYILYLIFSEKGKRVMSPEYRAIMVATPHIRYKTPLWVWGMLGILVVLMIYVIGLVTI